MYITMDHFDMMYSYTSEAIQDKNHTAQKQLFSHL